jgi:RNA polymerase sigma-70 factor (ECF subfamily)
MDATVLSARARSTTVAGEWPGDDAFRAFYAVTSRPLWGYLRSACGDAAAAEDMVQEAYLRILSADLAGEEESGRRAYLYRIATNLLHDHWRRARRQPAPDPLDADDDAAAITRTSSVGDRVDVRRALARLTPRDRQLLWLAHVEGSSHREVASILGLGAASVRVLLFRARRRLASALEQAGREVTP